MSTLIEAAPSTLPEANPPLGESVSIEDFARHGHRQELVPGGEAGYTFGLPLEVTPLDSTENLVDGQPVRQKLAAVVGRGDQTFGVIACQRADGSSFTVVRGLGVGGSANLIGVNGSTKAALIESDSPGAPDLRLKIGVEGGRITATDHSPTTTGFNEGISIVTAENTASEAPEQAQPQRTAIAGLKRALNWLRGHRNKKEAHQAQPAWALSAEELTVMSDRENAYEEILQSAPNMQPSSSALEAAYELGVTMGPEQQEMIFAGTLSGEAVDALDVARNGADVLSRRKYLAQVWAREPETARILVDVAGVHGSRSSALGSMLTPQLPSAGALYSSQTLNEMEGAFLTGGGDAFTTGAQQRVGFAALTQEGMRWAIDQYSNADNRSVKTLQQLENEQHTLTQYAHANTGPMAERSGQIAKQMGEAMAFMRQNPDSPFARYMLDDFPVVFGVSRTAANTIDSGHEQESLLEGSSDMDEFRPRRAKLELGNDLTVIGVPQDKVLELRDLLGQSGYDSVQVVPLEALRSANRY